MPPSHAPQDEASRIILLEYQSRSEIGDALVQFNLGSCYYHGRLVDKDFAEAVKWFRKAAKQNFTEAQFILGRCYANGEGVAKDKTEAEKWKYLANNNSRETPNRSI
ncbi:MAG: sel1 repeat family protein [Pedosphaera sp.]|nr:sel1 repeat family protein [Pedosphaera sp.]